MIKNIYRITAVILITFIFALNIFAQETPKDMVKVKVAVLPFLSFAPFFIADKEGFFKEHGLEPEFIRMQEGYMAISALINGDIDVYGGGLNVALFSALRNENIKIVANKGVISSDCPYFYLLTNSEIAESDGALSADRLKQVRMFSLHKGNIIEYIVSKFFEKFQLNPNEMQPVKIPYSMLSKAFKNNEVDIISIGEPWKTIIMEENKNIIVWGSVYDVMPNHQMGFVAYGKTFLSDKPDVGKRFMTAYLKGVRQYNQGKTERNLETIAEATKLDKEILKKACWPTIYNNGKINSDTIIPFQNWAIKEGLLDPPIIEEEKFWTSEFIDHANKILGE